MKDGAHEVWINVPKKPSISSPNREQSLRQLADLGSQLESGLYSTIYTDHETTGITLIR